MENSSYNLPDEELNLREELIKYISFWPYFLILFGILLGSAYIYLRYATYKYESTAIIEILDESQDSEMALPTELTVFNRSMINLENEINRLNSFTIHSQVVKELNSNILYYNVGNIKTSLTNKEYWFKDYEIDFKINTDDIIDPMLYSINISDNNLIIDEYDTDNDIIKTNIFDSLTTLSKNHSLPFDLTINSDDNLTTSRELKIFPVKAIANQFRGQLETSILGKDSDQLSLSLIHENSLIGEEYLNGLLLAFDQDGIKDRQREYQRTIEFVNEREIILKKELELVELRKQKFKQANNLSDLSLDAGNNIDLKYTYNTEIFQSESQKTIANYLLESINNNKYDYLPINIGLENFDLNNIIIDYNKIVTERNKYLSEAGPNNLLVKTLQSQLDSLIQNISTSIENYLDSIDLKIRNLKAKELEFENIYNRVPENEKTLRSIERELSIKEALYLLLLQKREEAAINLAVVKPTIKIIDLPITNGGVPKSPNRRLIYLFSIIASIVIYIGVLYLWFFIDNKIHTKDQLSKKLFNKIPILCEIPYIKDQKALTYTETNQNNSSRSILSESIRMLISNLKYIISDLEKANSCVSLIFTSSIKGEGKTLASANTAINLANETDKRVLLIGADLRNPQLHKIFGVDRNIKGLTEILYENNLDKYEDYLNKYGNLDVMYSGSIPPNPTSLLGSKSFQKLFLNLKAKYDYIIIDSAPCLLVSDTFQLVDYVDSIVYLFRANFTDENIVDYINEHYTTSRISKLSVVLNAVGNSSSYGYKYGYQYGYRYGYKYGYNYGYGYGYGTDSKS